MAARTPRRTFAHPFVVTLAAMPACVASTAPAPAPTPAPAPGPAPSPAPAPAPDATRWYIAKGGGDCTAREKVDCPRPQPGRPIRTCNPPASRPYPCPDGMTDGGSLTVVRYANAQDCVVEVPPVRCPPNLSCNPPPPARVACPE